MVEKFNAFCDTTELARWVPSGLSWEQAAQAQRDAGDAGEEEAGDTSEEDQLSEAAAEMQRQRDSMSRALSFFSNRELSRGWLGWVSHWESAVRRRESLHRGLSHLANQELSLGWTSWVTMATERRESLGVMRRALSYLVNHKLAAAFMSWLDVVAARVEAMGEMRRSLTYLVNHSVAVAFVTWLHVATTRRKALGVMRRALSYLVNHKLASAFVCWWELSERRSGSAATPTLSWSYRVLRVLQLQHHVPAELVPGPGAARLVFACGALHPLNRFVRHGLRLPVAQQAPSLVLDGVTITDELTLELVQAHAASAPAGMTAGTPALLVSRVVLAVLTPGAAGKASLLPSYVVDYALEALTAQLFDGN